MVMGSKQELLHVNDAVDVMRNYWRKNFGNIYNLGGKNISISGLAKKIIRLSNSTSKIIFKDYKYSYSNKGKFRDDYEDIIKRHPDISLIKKNLNLIQNIL